MNSIDRIVHHGTNFIFSRFNRAHLGRSCENPTTRFGFFFTECPADALSWAVRASSRHRAPNTPRVLDVHLTLHNPLELTPEQFDYYLRTARGSTIDRHRNAWIAAGHDGLTMIRDGVRWFVAFDPISLGSMSVRIEPTALPVVPNGAVVASFPIVSLA